MMIFEKELIIVLIDWYFTFLVHMWWHVWKSKLTVNNWYIFRGCCSFWLVVKSYLYNSMSFVDMLEHYDCAFRQNSISRRVWISIKYFGMFYFTILKCIKHHSFSPVPFYGLFVLYWMLTSGRWGCLAS